MTRILLIDNDAARRALMAGELREHGFDVEEHDNLWSYAVARRNECGAEKKSKAYWAKGQRDAPIRIVSSLSH